MAHIPDGVLSAPVLFAGAIGTVAVTTIAVRRLDYDRIPQAAVLAAGFFVASLVTVPVGPSAVHLMLTGLMGLLLGWAAVPAILVALVMQAIFFGYGGLVVMGVNAFNIAIPALLASLLFANRVQQSQGAKMMIWAAIAGASTVALTGLLLFASLALSGTEYLAAGQIILLTYLPLMVVEGLVTAIVLRFIVRVAPELLSEGRV